MMVLCVLLLLLGIFTPTTTIISVQAATVAVELVAYHGQLVDQLMEAAVVAYRSAQKKKMQAERVRKQNERKIR